MEADIVRLSLHEVDIKVVAGERMHVLQWRRHLTHDTVLIDGKPYATSYGLFGREKVYGLIFGQDEEGQGGERVMLLLDPKSNYGNWNSMNQQLSGVRLEAVDGPIVAYGTLDPRSLEKPATFAEWMKKTMGMEW